MAEGRANQLARSLGLWGLVATGVSTMVGGAINVLPLMLHRSVPSIGPNVALAYALAAIPAIFAALAYARLAAAMPQAGGSYIYVSRALHPFVGFVASFCQWFGLSIMTGVVAYLVVPFLRDFVAVLSPEFAQSVFQMPWLTIGLPIALLWLFAAVNMLGARTYALTIVPLMIIMFSCSLVVVVAGFTHDHADFLSAAGPAKALGHSVVEGIGTDRAALLAAVAILFGSFIGFETIALAGGEARNPRRTLPLAILIAIGGVAIFYLAFTLAVYHAIPWQYAQAEAQHADITVPGVMTLILPRGWAALVAAGAALSIVNHLPAMLLSVSRMLFAWADDGILPAAFCRLSPVRHTPDLAILTSVSIATLSVLACHFAGDFFLGVDLLTTTMLMNFLLVCLSFLVLLLGNQDRARQLGLTNAHRWEAVVPIIGILMLSALLASHLRKDLTASVDAWYFRSSWVLVVVFALAGLLFVMRRHLVQHRHAGVSDEEVSTQP